MLDGETELADLHRMEDNKLLVVRFTEDVLLRGKTERLSFYLERDQLLQHSPYLEDGTTALLASLGEPSEGQTRYLALHRVLGEGNFVLAVSEAMVVGQHSAIYDLYRIHEGRIAEHWDVTEPIPPLHAWKNFNGKF